MMGSRELRAFCRPPMGVLVSFAGVSQYSDDGSAICGLLDRPAKFAMEDSGVGGVAAAHPELRLPCNAFAPMPDDGDTITVTDEGVSTDYVLNAPLSEDDGAFFCYQLFATDGAA